MVILDQMSSSHNLGEVQLRINPTGTFEFFRTDSQGSISVEDISTHTRAVAGIWQHVVAVYSRTLARMKLYVNSTEVASAAPFGTDLLANAHDISLGARQLSTTDYNLNLSGVLDDVRVYGRALTPSDVAALYYDAPPLGPTIVQGPQEAYTALGGSATFSVIADGTAPLSYHWQKGGDPIPNATNNTRVSQCNRTSHRRGRFRRRAR